MKKNNHISFGKRVSAAVCAWLLFFAHAAFAQSHSGAYLASKIAQYDGDFENIAKYGVRALAQDSKNPMLQAALVQAYLAMGDIDKAAIIGRTLDDQGVVSQAARVAITAQLLKRGDFARILDRIETDRGIGNLIDVLIGAWATYALGDPIGAATQLQSTELDPSVQHLAVTHLAYIYALLGDYEQAITVFNGTKDKPVSFTLRSAIAMTQLLAAVDRKGEAVKFAVKHLDGTDSGATLIADILAGAQVDFDLIKSPQDAVAEVFHTIAAALATEEANELALEFANAAVYLRPDMVDGLIVKADVLMQLGEYTRAEKTFAKVPLEHPSYLHAELRRIDSLIDIENHEAAHAAYDRLTQNFANNARLWISKGDFLRALERYDEAIVAYDKAVGIQDPEAQRSWYAHYVRGTSYERLGNWPKAEVDLRQALKLSPENAHVLNYLGYSLITQNKDLNEALKMVRKAITLEPDNAYIIDSLAWGLYNLGAYKDAVAPMEDAAQLMPADPIINDHLGDILWAVGRHREARFHWRRALSFITDETDLNEVNPDILRQKLDQGLVLPDKNSVPAPKPRP